MEDLDQADGRPAPATDGDSHPDGGPTLQKAAAIIAADPALVQALSNFANHWGMDFYDPPEDVMSVVRQLVQLALLTARSQQMEKE